LTQPTL